MLVVVPVVVGGIIYFGFRTERLLMFGAAERLGLGGAVDWLQAAVQPWRAHLPAWVIFSLPHALWTFSMLCFVAWVWRGDRVYLQGWVVACAALAGGSELLQAVSLVPGTFCFTDLTGIAGAYAAFGLVLRLQSTTPFAQGPEPC